MLQLEVELSLASSQRILHVGAALELDQNHPRNTQPPGTMGPASVQATKTQDSASLDVSQNTPEVFIQML